MSSGSAPGSDSRGDDLGDVAVVAKILRERFGDRALAVAEAQLGDSGHDARIRWADLVRYLNR